MLRLIPANAAIVACVAKREVLEGADLTGPGLTARVAPDELWLIGRLDQRAACLDLARAAFGATGLVVDQTDGWWVVTASGDEYLEVPRRLMFASVPEARPALVQGAVTGVPGKVFYETSRLHLFVPAPVGHHLMERLAAVTNDLAVQLESPTALMVETPGAAC